MLANGHVNLTLGHRIGDNHFRLDAAQSVEDVQRQIDAVLAPVIAAPPVKS